MRCGWRGGSGGHLIHAIPRRIPPSPYANAKATDLTPMVPRNMNLRRRCVAFGLVATTLCGAAPELAAQERDAPIFRSGRFQFTLLP